MVELSSCRTWLGSGTYSCSFSAAVFSLSRYISEFVPFFSFSLCLSANLQSAFLPYRCFLVNRVQSALMEDCVWMEVSFPFSYFTYPYPSSSTDLNNYMQVSASADHHQQCQHYHYFFQQVHECISMPFQCITKINYQFSFGRVYSVGLLKIYEYTLYSQRLKYG